VTTGRLSVCFHNKNLM